MSKSLGAPWVGRERVGAAHSLSDARTLSPYLRHPPSLDLLTHKLPVCNWIIMGGWGDVAVMQGPALSDLAYEEPGLLSDPFPPGTPLRPSGLDVCPQDLLTGLLFSLWQPKPLSHMSPMSSPSVPCGPLSPVACPSGTTGEDPQTIHPPLTSPARLEPGDLGVCLSLGGRLRSP